MVATITIRQVPDEVRNELAARAARTGRSLQEYMLSEIVKIASKPPVADLMDDVRRRKRRTGREVSAEVILAARDADRR